jgi:hypothetical protein
MVKILALPKRSAKICWSRVFLPDKTQRSTVCALLGEKLSLDDFLISQDVESENGMMIMDLVQYLDEKGYEQIPPAYKALLKNVCKPSSAHGLLQVTNYLPLAYLESFCREELPLKDVGRLVVSRRSTKSSHLFI